MAWGGVGGVVQRLYLWSKVLEAETNQARRWFEPKGVSPGTRRDPQGQGSLLALLHCFEPKRNLQLLINRVLSSLNLEAPPIHVP